jgi:hypothetical protein
MDRAGHLPDSGVPKGSNIRREEALMRSLGIANLLVLAAIVALVLDSRRFNALARSTGRGRRLFTSGRGIPAGANPDQVGITLRQIQMRTNRDWQDGGYGWDGPEVLPAEESETTPVGAGANARPQAEEGRFLPVLWRPFPGLRVNLEAAAFAAASPNAPRRHADTRDLFAT